MVKDINCNLRKNWNNNRCKKRAGESEFRIIVPKADNSGKPIKKEFLRKNVDKMNRIFGGSTVIPKTKGCYLDDNKEFFCENSFMIIGARDFDSRYDKSLEKLDYKQRKEKLKEDYGKVKALALKISKELGQDTVFFEQVNLEDASTVGRKKSFKQSLPSSRLGEDELFFDD